MTRLIIIIPTEILTAVRSAATSAFGDVAKKEFVPAGSPTGNAPATHWWLAGLFTEEELQKVDALKTNFPTAHVESYSLARQANAPWLLLAALALKPIKAPTF